MHLNIVTNEDGHNFKKLLCKTILLDINQIVRENGTAYSKLLYQINLIEPSYWLIKMKWASFCRPQIFKNYSAKGRSYSLWLWHISPKRGYLSICSSTRGALLVGFVKVNYWVSSTMGHTSPWTTSASPMCRSWWLGEAQAIVCTSFLQYSALCELVKCKNRLKRKRVLFQN